MKGSLQQKKDMYYAVFRVNGEQKWVHLGIRAEKGNKRKAEKALQKVLREYENYSHSSEILFTDYMVSWLKDMEYIIKPSTYESYSMIVNKKLIPYFTNKSYSLSELKPNIFTEYFKHLKICGSRYKTGLSKKSVKNIRGVLSAMLEDAKKNQVIQTNPVTASRMPAFENDNKKEIVTYSPEEVIRLLTAAKETENHLYIFLLLALNTGLRKGELLALTWDDIDFDKKLLTVNKSRTGSKNTVTKLITTPKTESSNRIIPLSDNIISELNAEREKQKNHKSLFGNCYEDNHNFIIRNVNGKPYINLNAINRVLTRLCKNTGLTPITIHGLRHTVATIMDDNGVPIQEISILLGHEEVSTTERIYIHRKKTAKRESINILNNVIQCV